MNPNFFRKYADLIEAVSQGPTDPQQTQQYAQKIVDALDNQFGGGSFMSQAGQDGSVTIVQKAGGPSDPYDPRYENDPNVLTPASVSKVLDPYYNMFRQKGWRFDQPVGGQFTIAVTQAQPNM